MTPLPFPVPQTAKGRQMTVGDPSIKERFRESISVELRIRPRARDRAQIDEQLRTLLMDWSFPAKQPDFVRQSRAVLLGALRVFLEGRRRDIGDRRFRVEVDPVNGPSAVTLQNGLSLLYGPF
jgi:hypothetical protein